MQTMKEDLNYVFLNFSRGVYQPSWHLGSMHTFKSTISYFILF